MDQQTGDKTKKVSWLRLFGYRQMWAFFAGKFMTDGIWWFYLFWLPDYLHKQFDMTKQQIMLPTFIVYGVAIVGSIYGGSIPMTLIKRGMPVYQARMTTMFIIAVCPLAVLLTQYFGNVEHFGKCAAVPGRRHDLHRRDGASGVVGKSVHDRFRHVSEKSRRQRHRHRHDGRRHRRRHHLKCSPAGSPTISKHTPQTAYLIMFIICALSYLDRLGDHESAGAPARADHGFVKLLKTKAR